jgi:hypothetical protein
MKVNIAPQILSNSMLLMFVATANTVFESELGGTTDDISLDWSLVLDASQRPRLAMSMVNGSSCHGEFEIADISDMQRVRERFRNWCCDLISSHRGKRA